MIGVPTISLTRLPFEWQRGLTRMATPQRIGSVLLAYTVVSAYRSSYAVQAMCRILELALGGYCEWLQRPISNRAKEDAILLRLVRASFGATLDFRHETHATRFGPG